MEEKILTHRCRLIPGNKQSLSGFYIKMEKDSKPLFFFFFVNQQTLWDDYINQQVMSIRQKKIQRKHFSKEEMFLTAKCLMVIKSFSSLCNYNKACLCNPVCQWIQARTITSFILPTLCPPVPSPVIFRSFKWKWIREFSHTSSQHLVYIAREFQDMEVS